MDLKRFLIVPVLSSAARMPLPGATSAWAVAARSGAPACIASISSSLLVLVRSSGRFGHLARRGAGGTPWEPGERLVRLILRSRACAGHAKDGLTATDIPVD